MSRMWEWKIGGTVATINPFFKRSTPVQGCTEILPHVLFLPTTKTVAVVLANELIGVLFPRNKL
jgi:hypothetical protein